MINVRASAAALSLFSLRTPLLYLISQLLFAAFCDVEQRFIKTLFIASLNFANFDFAMWWNASATCVCVCVCASRHAALLMMALLEDSP